MSPSAHTFITSVHPIKAFVNMPLPPSMRTSSSHRPADKRVSRGEKLLTWPCGAPLSNCHLANSVQIYYFLRQVVAGCRCFSGNFPVIFFTVCDRKLSRFCAATSALSVTPTRPRQVKSNAQL